MKTQILIGCVVLLLVFSGCQDTRSFENARKIETGMTISQVEKYMGKPISYRRENDTTEERRYVYDSPGNGMDIFIIVIYQDGIVLNIKN